MFEKYRKFLNQGYSEIEAKTPKMFLQSFFGRNSEELQIVNTRSIVLEYEAELRKVALVRARCEDGNLNRLHSPTTIKEFTPPFYDEYTIITGDDLDVRHMGDHEFVNRSYVETLQYLVLKAFRRYQNKIVRAIELQASQMIFEGKVLLQNNDVIDVQRDASLTVVNAGTDLWSDPASDPVAQLGALADAVYDKSGLKTNICLMGAQAFANFKTHEKVLKSLDNRRVELGSINPQALGNGSYYQGTIQLLDTVVDIYTYSEKYNDKDGNLQSFIPSNKVALMSTDGRYDKYFAGIPLLTENEHFRKHFGMSMPSMATGQMVPYGWEERATGIAAGLRSAPLLVSITDSIATIQVI